MRDWLLSRREFLISSGLLSTVPFLRKPRRKRHHPHLLLLLVVGA